MKNAIVYGIIFLLAFIGTTAGIYFMNNKFVNMFEFDFRNAREVAMADSLALIATDSLVVSDTTFVAESHVDKNEELEKHITETKAELNKTSEKLSKREKELERLRKQLEEKNAAEHEKWLKSTIKLYEAMDVNKAGQLLKSLPENEARELVYAMKQKKAAEILSNLDTETVKRLTRADK